MSVIPSADSGNGTLVQVAPSQCRGGTEAPATQTSSAALAHTVDTSPPGGSGNPTHSPSISLSTRFPAVANPRSGETIQISLIMLVAGVVTIFVVAPLSR